MKVKFLKLTLIVCAIVHATVVCAQEHLKSRSIHVEFSSEAPLEMIFAAQDKGEGVLSLADQEFVFRISIQSFAGFNSPLQLEHFNENYMESEEFEYATFRGRIVDEVDFSQPGRIEVLASGVVEIHGVEDHRIIPVKMEIREGEIFFSAEFEVSLEDHDIRIPRLVEHNLASTIKVKVNGVLQ